jgi:RNase P/RNase MRP subunit p30
MVVDVGVNVSNMERIGSFEDIAQRIGFTGIAVTGVLDQPIRFPIERITVYRRVNLTGKGINALRNQLEKVRKNTTIVSIQVGSIDVTNWAVEDQRIDLLTLDPLKDHKLRETTACLASKSLTALELQIAPLLSSSGLHRSKILKVYREAVMTAVGNGMEIVLSSGATHPMGLRSPLAMVHIGMLLGIDRTLAERSINDLPAYIIERSLKKLRPEFISPGVEVIRRSEST